MRISTYVMGVVLLGAAALAVAAWAGTEGRPSAPPAAESEALPLESSAIASHEMEVAWQTRLILDPGTTLRRLWLRGDFLVGLASDNRIHVVSAATGVRMYSRQVALPAEMVWPPAASKDVLFVPTTTTLWAFRGPDGNSAGHRLLGFSPSGGSVTNGVQVFLPDARGWVQALSVSPDTLQWNLWKTGRVDAAPVIFRGIEEVQNERPKFVSPPGQTEVRGDAAKGWGGESWGRWTEDTMTAAPAIDSSMVYFAGQNGVVYASMQNVRNVAWEYQTEGAVVADLKRTKSGLVLAASLDYTLYAFTGSSGRVVWRYNAGERLRRAPYVLGKQVFLPTREAGLIAIDAANGKPQWTLAEGVGILAGDNDTVYALSREGALLAVERGNGRVKFSAPLKPGVLAATNESESGFTYLGTQAGQIMAVSKKRDLLEIARKEAEELAAKEAAAAAAATKKEPAPEKPPQVTTPTTPAEPATPKEPPPKKAPPPKREPPPKKEPPPRPPRKTTK